MQAFLQPQGTQQQQSDLNNLIPHQNLLQLQQLLYINMLNSYAPQIQSQPHPHLLMALKPLVSLTQLHDHFPVTSMHIITKLIANFVLQALKNTNEFQYLLKDPLSIQLQYAEWVTLCDTIINSQVKNDNTFTLCKSLLTFSSPLFAKALFRTMAKYSQTEMITQNLSLRTLNEFLQSEDRNQEFLYYMLCIEDTTYLSQESFINCLQRMFCRVANYLHTQNIMEQMINNQMKSKHDFETEAEKYLNIMSIFQNCDERLIINQFISTIFEQETLVDCQHFLNRIKNLNDYQMNILFVLLDLIMLENKVITLLTEDSTTQVNDSNPLQQYRKLIEKLKNKCKGKEDEFCNCKRCQCIKRNRDSARESQKRKREALEKLGPLQQEYEKLVKKVKIVEEKNGELKKLLIDMMKDPTLSSLLHQEYQDKISKLSSFSQLSHSQ